MLNLCYEKKTIDKQKTIPLFELVKLDANKINIPILLDLKHHDHHHHYHHCHHQYHHQQQRKWDTTMGYENGIRIWDTKMGYEYGI